MAWARIHTVHVPDQVNEATYRRPLRLRSIGQQKWNKKFELMLTKRAKAYSSFGLGLAENWDVQAKLKYKYQILIWIA